MFYVSLEPVLTQTVCKWCLLGFQCIFECISYRCFLFAIKFAKHGRQVSQIIWNTVFIAAAPSGWCCGEVFEGVGHKCTALLAGPARDLRTDWGRNGFCFSWNRSHSGTYSGQHTNKPTVDFPKYVCSHLKLDFTFKLQGSNVRLLLRNCGFFVIWCHAKVILHYMYADKVNFADTSKNRNSHSTSLLFFLSTGLYPLQQ